jgi:hypothetical protein
MGVLTLRWDSTGGHMLSRSWEWRHGELTGPLLNEVGAMCDEALVSMLLDYEGTQLSLFLGQR